MGNRASDNPEKDRRERRFEEDSSSEQNGRKSSYCSTRRRGRKRGSRSSKKNNSQIATRDDPHDMFTDIMEFGFGRGAQSLGFGFGEEMERMMMQARSSTDGGFHSTQMFSSITTIGDDGVPVSESKGVSTSSNGRYQMAHQRRIGDRSQTLMRQRQNEKDKFQESQRLHQITHDDLPKFSSEFKDRTNEWRSHNAIRGARKPGQAIEDGRQSGYYNARNRDDKPRLAIEDGRRSRAVHPREVSKQNYRRKQERSKYRARGIEY